MKHKRNRRPRGRAAAPVDLFDDSPNESDTSFFFSNSQQRRSNHKLQQLCRQVYRTLIMGLAGDDDDPVLQDLAVHSVLPAPNASRLLVNVYSTTATVAPPDVVLERLNRAAPRVRAEVARAIVRKRAPELVFNVVPPGAGEVTSWH